MDEWMNGERLMVMKRYLYILIIMCVGAWTQVHAQTQADSTRSALKVAAQAITDWNTETMLDSLDQEKLPKKVTCGILVGANLNNFVITRDHHTMHSHMRIGAELGGFVDFKITPHFAIQPQVFFTAQQNHFSVADTFNIAASDTTNHLWSFGMDIPIYFLGRFGNMKQGYVQFGGGIFTHFTFASNTGKYKNVDNPLPAASKAPVKVSEKKDLQRYDYSRLYTLHNNHFGLCLMVGYEFAFGMQINLHYKISLSDIAGFYSEMKGQEIADALIMPQTFSLTVGYRWR